MRAMARQRRAATRRSSRSRRSTIPGRASAWRFFARRCRSHERWRAEDGVFGAAVDDALLDAARSQGRRSRSSSARRIEIRAPIVSEPDRLGDRHRLRPARPDFARRRCDATGLVQPGSLVRWTTRVLLGARRARRRARPRCRPFSTGRRRRFRKPAGRRGRANVSPDFSRATSTVSREFLALVGLISLIVGGVGVANAAQGFVERKRATLAILKSVGATGGAVVLLALVEFLAVALDRRR